LQASWSTLFARSQQLHRERKVPTITIVFWAVKLLTTAVGESTSDFLVHVVNPVVAVLAGAVGLALALVLQFRARRYNAWAYWFAVTMVAVFGTMAADVLHIVIGVPYVDSTIFFAGSLGVVFALWYTFEKTLSIHRIDTGRRELFYWLTVMVTFALGTAAGDMTAVTLRLGFLASGILFAGLIALVTAAHYAAKAVLDPEHPHQSRNAVLAFWLAYIITRPLGASFADWTGKAPSFGGLGWGDGTVTIGLSLLIVAFVWLLAATRFDNEDERTARIADAVGATTSAKARAIRQQM
jgi:uncharacterized membrane-anchored protein